MTAEDNKFIVEMENAVGHMLWPRKEIDRLCSIIRNMEALHAGYWEGHEETVADILKLQIQNAKLRRALEEIIHEGDEDRIYQVARTALQED